MNPESNLPPVGALFKVSFGPGVHLVSHLGYRRSVEWLSVNSLVIFIDVSPDDDRLYLCFTRLGVGYLWFDDLEALETVPVRPRPQFDGSARRMLSRW